MTTHRWNNIARALLFGFVCALAIPGGGARAQTEGENAPGVHPGMPGWGQGWGRPGGSDWRDLRQQQWEAQQWRQQQQWQRQQWEAQQWRQQQQPQYYGGPTDQWGRPIRPPAPGWHVDPYTGRRERILN